MTIFAVARSKHENGGGSDNDDNENNGNGIVVGIYPSPSALFEILHHTFIGFSMGSICWLPTSAA